MSQPLTDLPAPKPPRKRRRWLWIGIASLVVLLLMGSAAGVFYWYQTNSFDQQLQAVIAELDASDPHWRLHEIEAQRPKLPDEQNAALVVIAAHSKLPDDWGLELFHLFWEELPSPVQLDEAQFEALQEEFKTGQAVLAEIQKLADYAEGRYAIKHGSNWLSISVPDIKCAQPVALLLEYHAKLRAQENEMEDAWKSSEVVYRIGMSVGNIDGLVLLATRLKFRNEALNSMERVLAQGEVKAESLAKTQALLEKDLQEPILVAGLRGERAGLHLLYIALEEGTVTLKDLGVKQPPVGVESLRSFFDTGKTKRSHIYMLDYLTKNIEIVKEKKDHTIHEELRNLEAEFKSKSVKSAIFELALLVVPATRSIINADIRTRTRMQCAICALAAERYRLQHQHWPDSLKTLVKENLIKEVPVDPYDDQPLRYRQTKNGIIIFSIGPKHYENQGDSLDNPDLEEPRYRSEFRLWNPDRRRQPPRPPKKEDDPLDF